MRRWLLSILLSFLLLPGTGTCAPAQATGGDGPVLEVFVREGCRYCAAAKLFLPGFAAAHPGLTIVYRDVDVDAVALDDLFRHAEDAGRGPAVPMFHFEGRVLFGFVSPEETGPRLAAMVEGRAPAAPPAEFTTRLFGTLSVGRMGLPAFTIAMGLLDGLNPCVTWALLFLLSMMPHLHDRRRFAAIAGTYVLATAAMHYALMAAWLNVFLLAGMSGALQRMLAAAALLMGLLNLKDAAFPGSRVSLSIPHAARPGLGARMRDILATRSLAASLVAVVGLAVAVNGAELLCTAAFPALYTAALSQQDLTPLVPYGYLALYTAAYALPATVLSASAVAALGSRRLTERAGRGLKLVSGVVMIGLAFTLALRGRLFG
jgi:hypothetical protein